MRWRTTVVLVAVAGALAVYLLLVERRLPTTVQLEERRQRLFDLSAEDVNWLRIEHGDVALTLERSDAEQVGELARIGGTTWRMTEPVRARAAGYVCDQLARDLEHLEWESRMTGPPDGEPESRKVSERGLDRPRASLSFRHRGGEEKVYFGDDTPLGARVYLSVEGRPDIYEVRRSFLGALLRSVDEFRDDDVLVFDLPDVRKLSVTRAQDTLAVEREGRRWLLTQPLPAVVRADRDKVEDALRKLSSLRVERFVADSPVALSDEKLGRYGLDAPVLTAEVEADGQTLSISFGSAVPDHPDWRYATTGRPAGPSVYAVKAEPAEFLASPVIEFRDRQLTPMTADRVQTLTITLAPAEEEAEPETVVVVRAEGTWRIRQPRDIEADEDAVRQLLRDLDTGHVTAFVKDFAEPPGESELAPYGLERPRATITLVDDQEEEETIHVGARDQAEGRCYLRRGQEHSVLAADEEFFDLAVRGYLAYRTKELTQVRRFEVTGIRIERPDGRVELIKEKNDWQLTAPIEKRAERSAVDDLLFELTPLVAERIVTEQADDLADYGLDKPAYRLEVVLQKEGEEAETIVLSIGEALPEGDRAARLGEERLVAALSESFLERLDAEFRYRTVLTFDRDQADELTITGVTPAVAAAKVQDTWQLREPADADLDPAKVRGLLGELRSLRVQRWDTYQATDLAAYGLDEPTLIVSVHVGGLEPTTHTLMFGTEAAGGSVFARLEGDPGVFLLPQRVAQKARQSILVEPEEEEEPEAAPSEEEPEEEPGVAEQPEAERAGISGAEPPTEEAR